MRTLYDDGTITVTADGNAVVLRVHDGLHGMSIQLTIGQASQLAATLGEWVTVARWLRGGEEEL